MTTLDTLLAVLAEDTGGDGPVTPLRADVDRVEERATEIVRGHALRPLDALHLAVAELAALPLTEPGRLFGFATGSDLQRAAPTHLGFVIV